MRNIFRIILSLIFSFWLMGCKANYKDISADPEFSHYVGEKYKLKSDMDFSGVNAPPGYSNEINFYVISSRDPGWSGREVVTRETLPSGSIIKIVKVEECTNCLTFGDPPRNALVSIEGKEEFTNLPIELYLYEIVSGKHLERVQ